VESDPLNGSFEFLGFDSKNFIFNSGSYFIFVFILSTTFIYSRALQYFAKKYPYNEYLRNKAIENSGDIMRQGLNRLFLEEYFYLAFGCFLNIQDIIETIAYEEDDMRFKHFRGTSNIICTVTTIIFLI